MSDGSRPPRHETVLLGGFVTVLLIGFLATLVNEALFEAPDDPIIDGSWSSAYQERLDAESPIARRAATLWSVLDLLLFGQAPEGVVLGDDGWLFTAEEYSLADEPQAVLSDWVTTIAAVAEGLDNVGIELLVAPVPAKAVMVAKGQPPLPLPAQGRYEAVLAELHDAGVATVDLRPALDEPEAWLRTDTHWSPRGASAAADLVVAALPGRWSEAGAGHVFAVTSHEVADFSGDLHTLLGLGRMAGIVGPRVEPVTGETFHFESDPGTDLFAEVSVDIALVGTSYSAGEHWSLAERLAARTGAEVIDVSTVGRGPLAPMLEYLVGPTFAAAPPAAVVWEVPVRYLTTTAFLDPVVDRLELPGEVLGRAAAVTEVATAAAPSAVPMAAAPGAGTLVTVDHVRRLSAADVDAQVTGRFLNDGERPPFAQTEVDLYVLEFVTTGPDGAGTTGTAQLFAPVTPVDDALLAFAPGSTGLAPSCGPMAELLAGGFNGYSATAAAYAGQGLPTVLPEYVYTLEPGGLQPYFVADAEAAVVLDALRAATSAMTDVGNGASVAAAFIAGFSQGGHSAFAAADRAAAYAPELPLRGVAGFGASGDLYTLFQHFHYTAPWVLWAYERLYADLDLSRILAPAYAEELDAAVNDLCILGAQARYPSVASSLYTEEFFAALESGTLQQSFPELDEMFVANATGMAAHRLPVMILHGVNDPVVPLLVQDDFVEQLCELGSPVRYANYLRTRHETRYIGFDDALAWMRQMMRGEVAPSDCSAVGE